jgi:hypothetical protein
MSTSRIPKDKKLNKGKTVAILYIGIGKYSVFFNNFYKSCESKFLKNYKKVYYVFTDDESISSGGNIVKIFQEKIGWPYDSMFRFKFFNSIKDQILNHDYCFFFNANMLFHEKIGEEVLPKREHSYLVGVNHPGFFNKPERDYSYERNESSLVSILRKEGKVYYQGCLSGGRTFEYIEMSMILEKRLDIDLSNGIVPVWIDESALNWYYSKFKPLCLSPSYAYPQSQKLPFRKKIIQLDKAKLGGHDQLRS